MITLNASGGSVTFTFSGNSTYLNDGTIEVPVNSLALIIDESDMVTFKKSQSSDIFVSANIAEFGMTKDELESWFKANAVGSTGGGGGITSGEVQTMIDESISGKADTDSLSAYTINEGVASSSQTYVVETPNPYGSQPSIVNTLDKSYGGLRVYKVNNYSTCYLIGYDENDTEIGRITFSSENPPFVYTTGFTDVVINREYISNSAGTVVIEGKELTAIKKFSFYNNYWATDEETSVYFYNKAYNVTDAVRFDFAKKADGINVTWGPWPELLISLTSGERTITGVAAYFDSKYFRSYYDQYDNHLLSIKENAFQDYAKSSAVTEEISAAVSGMADSSAVTEVSDVLTAHTANTTVHITAAERTAWNAKSDFSGSYNDLTDKPTIPTVPTSNTAFTNDAGYITSGEAQTEIDNSISGKVDASTYTAYTAATDAALASKQTTLTAGTNITISGNVISATGGGGGTSYIAGTGIDITSDVISVTGMVATSAVTSAVTSGDTNPVQNQALWNELRISNGGETETTLRFVMGGPDSTNYPEGCTKIKVEVIGSMNESRISFFNDGQDLGEIEILNYDNVSVNSNFDGATYEISGTTVIISYPTITNVTKIRVHTYDSNYIYKAVTTEPPTAVKDQVVANTTALGGLKLQQISQSDYDNLPTKDSSTLYIII